MTDTQLTQFETNVFHLLNNFNAKIITHIPTVTASLLTHGLLIFMVYNACPSTKYMIQITNIWYKLRKKNHKTSALNIAWKTQWIHYEKTQENITHQTNHSTSDDTICDYIWRDKWKQFLQNCFIKISII